MTEASDLHHVVRTAPIRNQAQLARAWRALISPLGFAQESLWFMFLNPDRTAVPCLTQLEETTLPPSREHARALAAFLIGIAEDLPGDNPSVAFLRSRPGNCAPTTRDRAWAQSLYAACQEAELPCEVVHLATDRHIVPIPWRTTPWETTAMPA
jgi:hypothetical protein